MKVGCAILNPLLGKKLHIGEEPIFSEADSPTIVCSGKGDAYHISVLCFERMWTLTQLVWKLEYVDAEKLWENVLTRKTVSRTWVGRLLRNETITSVIFTEQKSRFAAVPAILRNSFFPKKKTHVFTKKTGISISEYGQKLPKWNIEGFCVSFAFTSRIRGAGVA